MKITKIQLKECIRENISKSTVKDDELFEIVSQYADSNGKISTDKFIFVMNKLNRDFTAKLIYNSLESVLSKLKLLDDLENSSKK
ncbi:hypothetical protein HMPREF3188_00053 [Tissierellia bacterium KA00581]|nr:hypothetical protein HMPREF3188_00053 [Tissierellia bacterium KA00581]